MSLHDEPVLRSPSWEIEREKNPAPVGFESLTFWSWGLCSSDQLLKSTCLKLHILIAKGFSGNNLAMKPSTNWFHQKKICLKRFLKFSPKLKATEVDLWRRQFNSFKFLFKARFERKTVGEKINRRPSMFFFYLTNLADKKSPSYDREANLFSLLWNSRFFSPQRKKEEVKKVELLLFWKWFCCKIFSDADLSIFHRKKQKKILESMGDRVEVTTGLLCELLVLLRAVCII